MTHSDRPAGPAPGDGGLTRVLVVDDHGPNRLALSRLVERLGAVVETAADGLIALERLLGAGPIFDLVLLDVELPGIDGITLAERLGPPGPGAPMLVAVTADAGADRQAACLAAGMVAVLAKPLRLDGLREVLGRARRARSGKRPTG